MKEQDRREWNPNGDGPLRDGTSFKCLSCRGCCPPPRCTSTAWKNMRTNDVPDHTVPASFTSSPLIFLLVSISSVFVQAVGLRTYGSKHSLLACRSSFTHSPSAHTGPRLTGIVSRGGPNPRGATQWQGHYASQGAKCPSHHSNKPAWTEKIDEWESGFDLCCGFYVNTTRVHVQHNCTVSGQTFMAFLYESPWLWSGFSH